MRNNETNFPKSKSDGYAYGAYHQGVESLIQYFENTMKFKTKFKKKALLNCYIANANNYYSNDIEFEI